jgi:beta-xylosidase-like protein
MEKQRVAAGDRAAFVAFCERAQQGLAAAGIEIALNQWYLEPGQPAGPWGRTLFEDHFDQPELQAGWEWHAPLPESAYSLSERPGYLVLCAPPDANLWPPTNLNAPRMLREARGEFALEARMEGDWEERAESVSGLLIWKDVLNYVRLNKHSMNTRHNADIALEARVRGEFRVYGRGGSRGKAYTLRLERAGEWVVGWCKAEGETWFRCGAVAFPTGDPLLVGVVALQGMVVHYDWIQVLGRESR